MGRAQDTTTLQLQLFVKQKEKNTKCRMQGKGGELGRRSTRRPRTARAPAEAAVGRRRLRAWRRGWGGSGWLLGVGDCAHGCWARIPHGRGGCAHGGGGGSGSGSETIGRLGWRQGLIQQSNGRDEDGGMVVPSLTVALRIK
jgi:hypothetical protein